jgi:hypothetical protein
MTLYTPFLGTNKGVLYAFFGRGKTTNLISLCESFMELKCQPAKKKMDVDHSFRWGEGKNREGKEKIFLSGA